MAATLVTLAQAKVQLRIPTDDTAHDVDIQLKLDDAEGLIRGRCDATAWWRAVTPTWTAANVPAGVRSAILLMLGHLYEHRGDDVAGTMRQPDLAVWAAVDSLIAMHRDPVIA